jgi:hypothetical protein
MGLVMHDGKDTDEMLGRIGALLESGGRRRRVFVDFDYSLFLSNSTEEFLNSAKPAFIAVLILKLLAIVRPWFLLSRDRGYFIWRDAIRVWTILIFMPWTLLLFKRNAQKVFNRDLNRELAATLQSAKDSEVIILSFGFRFIIRHLIARSPFASSKLIASSVWRPTRLRRYGKLAHLKALSFPADPNTDVVITDADDDDADLLTTFKNAFHVRWSNLNRTAAHEGTYIPFYYLAKIKRSPEFFIKSTLLEEFPIFVLAFLLYQPLHWEIMVSGSLLFLAFLIIYEIGYHENDHIGARYEQTPKLTAEFYRQQSYRVEPYAWYWMIVVTASAILVLDPDQVSALLGRMDIADKQPSFFGEAVLIGLWMLVAILARLIFFAFNHVPLAWRIFVFLPLHVLKYFAPLVIFPLHPAGFALLSAQVIRTWSVYAIRRCGGDIEFIVSQLIRLVFLVFLLISFALLGSIDSVFSSWQTWVILGWCIVRALPEMKRKLFNRDVLDEFVPWFGEETRPSG